MYSDVPKFTPYSKDTSEARLVVFYESERGLLVYYQRRNGILLAKSYKNLGHKYNLAS